MQLKLSKVAHGMKNGDQVTIDGKPFWVMNAEEGLVEDREPHRGPNRAQRRAMKKRFR